MRRRLRGEIGRRHHAHRRLWRRRQQGAQGCGRVGLSGGLLLRLRFTLRRLLSRCGVAEALQRRLRGSGVDDRRRVASGRRLLLALQSALALVLEPNLDLPRGCPQLKRQSVSRLARRARGLRVDALEQLLAIWWDAPPARVSIARSGRRGRPWERREIVFVATHAHANRFWPTREARSRVSP